MAYSLRRRLKFGAPASPEALMTETNKPTEPSTKKPTPEPVIVQAVKLFQGSREVWIEHYGVRYRLRITRRNKLILQK
jgi:hemin uptake protein HemP